MSYYQYIDGVRYARDLIQKAASSTQGRGESKISFDEIQAIYQSAQDGKRITETERRTIQYITEKFKLTDKALSWIKDKLEEASGENAVSQIIHRIIRKEFGLKELCVVIDASEVNRQEQKLNGAGRLFESALRGAIEALLFSSRDQLSFGAFINRKGIPNNFYPAPLDIYKEYLDQGTLYLVPIEAKQQEDFVLDIPDSIDLGEYWVFLLDVPAFSPAIFSAFVSRDSPNQFSKGFISTKPAFDELLSGIIKDQLGFDGLKWHISEEEVNNQLSTYGPNQNFGNALFAALNGGIFNGESSLSFRDFIEEDVWQDPYFELDEYMRAYIHTGTLFLVDDPKKVQTFEGVTFQLPEQFSLNPEQDWYFGLAMPDKTQVQFLINVPRSSADGMTGWNDGFILPEERSIVDQLKEQVLSREFDLPDLKLIFPVHEFEAQRTQFGPGFRNAQSLLRQAINTILDDYLTRLSVFDIVANVHQDDIDQDAFPDSFSYRSAVSDQILEYLKSASMELLPIELPDNNPIDGELIDNYWQFFVMLPELSDHGFWVIIPRYPEEEDRPYVYGFN